MNKKFLLSFLLSVLLVCSLIPLVNAAVFSDGFELGNGFGGWTATSGTPTIETSPVKEGINSSQINAAEYAYKDVGSDYTVAYARVYVYMATLPASGESAKVMYFYDVGAFQMGAGFANVAGVEKVFMSGDPGTTYVNFDYAVDTWYCLEMKWDTDTDNYGVWVDGTRYVDVSPAASAEHVSRFVIGTVSGPYTSQDFNVDSTVFDSSYIGPISGAVANIVDLTSSITIGLTKAEQTTFNVILSQGMTIGLTQYAALVYYVTLSLSANLAMTQIFQTAFHVILTQGINPTLATLVQTGFHVILQSTWTTTLLSYAINATAVFNHFIVDLALNIATSLLNPIEIATTIGSAFALAGLALIIALSAFGAIFLVRRRQN